MIANTMQDFKLRCSTLIDHAAREHGTRPIVSIRADGNQNDSCWRAVRGEAIQLAKALAGLGIARGDRVATLAMNHAEHLATWYGVMGVGAIVHTINPRLFDEQILYIINHAEDRILLYDASFQPIIDRLRDRLTTVEHYICFDSSEVERSFGNLIGAQDQDFAWVDGDEREANMLCYTSGTTGNPKGVLYQHRSTVLHAMAEIQPAVFDFAPASVILPVVPMFHAAAWGIPFAGAAVGAKLVLSATNDAAMLLDLMKREEVTHSAGVPTVWLSLLEHVEQAGATLDDLKTVIVGGSAAPREIVERFMRMGVRVSHAWGMTETSPIGTMGAPSPDWRRRSFDEKVDLTLKQGRTPFGVELRVVDEQGQDLPRDGQSAGRLLVRGAWVLQRYFKSDEDAVDDNGWFDTGDVAVIDGDGVLQLTDRAKDVIKSGGEWISSVELENSAISHPDILEAAAIGAAHPKWGERPLLLIVPKPGRRPSEADVQQFLAQRVAKWWVPEVILLVKELPHTATGKILKTELRRQYVGYLVDNATAASKRD